MGQAGRDARYGGAREGVALSRSALLRVVVDFNPDGEECDLLAAWTLEPEEPRKSRFSLSDAEWLREHVSSVGPWWAFGCAVDWPTTPGRYEFTGRIEGWKCSTDWGDEYDELFEFATKPQVACARTMMRARAVRAWRWTRSLPWAVWYWLLDLRWAWRSGRGRLIRWRAQARWPRAR